ncbi:hypothetical protein [Longimicrobium sp.]|uniref:hypothetical protein n=1 Tax=Longimicrobium sp. TaxID=2029185 RepID=UPI003B3BBA6C
MSATLRTILRTRAVAVLTAPLLLGSLAPGVKAASSSDAAADRVEYKYLYKDATYSNTVGIAYGFCDGDYILHSGYETPYVVVAQWYPCP